MEFIKLLINSEKYMNACFLCFRCDKSNLDIYTRYDISYEYNINISVSLRDMLKTLIPFQKYKDIPLRQFCIDCSGLLCKLYILIHKRKTKTMLLDGIVKQLQMTCNNISRNFDSNDKVFLAVHLPTFSETPSTLFKDEFENNEYSLNKMSNTDCVVCDKSCETAKDSDLCLHDNNIQVKSCPNCLETLKWPNESRSHSKRHKKKHQRKLIHYFCNDCNYKTLSKTTLQGHINKNHLHTRPYVCQVCCKGFYNKSNMLEHLKTHNNHRDQVCEICGCNFFHRKNLIEHLRLHSDTKPYECNVCSKRFVTSGRRSDHIKRTHMERSECCEICNKKYSLKKELRRHMNNVHLKNL